METFRWRRHPDTRGQLGMIRSARRGELRAFGAREVPPRIPGNRVVSGYPGRIRAGSHRTQGTRVGGQHRLGSRRGLRRGEARRKGEAARSAGCGPGRLHVGGPLGAPAMEALRVRLRLAAAGEEVGRAHRAGELLVERVPLADVLLRLLHHLLEPLGVRLLDLPEAGLVRHELADRSIFGAGLSSLRGLSPCAILRGS